MQIHDFAYLIQGFARLADYAIRWENMLSEKAEHKARELIPWLLWYNGERPHWGLKLKSHIQFLM